MTITTASKPPTLTSTQIATTMSPTASKRHTMRQGRGSSKNHASISAKPLLSSNAMVIPAMKLSRTEVAVKSVRVSHRSHVSSERPEMMNASLPAATTVPTIRAIETSTIKTISVAGKKAKANKPKRLTKYVLVAKPYEMVLQRALRIRSAVINAVAYKEYHRLQP